MLVITRTRGEAVVIGDDIEIQVLRVGRDGVRLGITAPPGVTVHRREVRDAIRTANASAAETSPDSVARLIQRMRRGSGAKD